jgi:hypothetical protein
VPGYYAVLLKIVLILDIVTILAFVGEYSYRADWWRDEIGRTIVVKDILLLAVIALVAASVFFQFSRLTSEVAAWTEIGMLGGVSLAMAWRTWVFEKVHKRGKK